MRITLGAVALFLLFVPAGGQTQDTSQLYYAIQSLQSEVRSLQTRVQQLESGQHMPRPRDDSGGVEALQRQLTRLEDRMSVLESRISAPKPALPKEPPKKQSPGAGEKSGDTPG